MTSAAEMTRVIRVERVKREPGRVAEMLKAAFRALWPAALALMSAVIGAWVAIGVVGPSVTFAEHMGAATYGVLTAWFLCIYFVFTIASLRRAQREASRMLGVNE